MNNSDLITRKMPSFFFFLILSPVWCLGSRFRRYFCSRNSPWERVSQVLSFLLLVCESQGVWMWAGRSCRYLVALSTECCLAWCPLWRSHSNAWGLWACGLQVWKPVQVWNSPSHVHGCHYSSVVFHLRHGLITAQQSYYIPTAVDFKPHYSLGALNTLYSMPTLPSSPEDEF